MSHGPKCYDEWSSDVLDPHLRYTVVTICPAYGKALVAEISIAGCLHCGRLLTCTDAVEATRS